MRTPADIAAFDQRFADALRSIWFLGDVHNEFRHIGGALKRCVKSKQDLPEWLVFLGDQDLELFPMRVAIESLRRVHASLKVAFIHGNHDGDCADKWALLHDCSDAVALHGQVVDLSGVRVAGLGGNFQGRVWAPPADPVHESREEFIRNHVRTLAHTKSQMRRLASTRDNAGSAGQTAPELVLNLLGKPSHIPGGEATVWPASPKLLAAIYPQDVTRLSAQRADILVTHEAPSCHRYGWAELDELARSLQVFRSFHGHTHDDLSDQYAQQIHQLGFDARAVGFCCIKNGLGELVCGPPEGKRDWT